MWTTFHLEAAFDRDVRHGGTPGGQDGWRLAAWDSSWDTVCACVGHGSDSPDRGSLDTLALDGWG